MIRGGGDSLMNYTQYKFARDLSWEILIRERVCALPVPMFQLCKQMGIAVKYDDGQLAEGSSGMAVKKGRKYIVIVRRDEPPQRQRFTIAHELGHILVGDVGRFKLVNREPSPMDNPIEKRANVFASRLLAPACVLWGVGAKSAADIAKLCDISPTAAAFRWKRLQYLYIQNHFLDSELEQKVFAQFKDYIEKNRF